MIFFALSLALGLLLAQRFKVFVIIPATLLMVMVALVGGMTGAEGFWPRALMALLGATTLQTGYLLGLSISSLWPAARIGRQGREATQPPRGAKMPIGPAPRSAR